MAKSKRTKKRKLSPAHLAALRAAGRKRRGKPRGPYKIAKGMKGKVNPIANILNLPDYLDYLPNSKYRDVELRRFAIDQASKIYQDEVGRHGSNTSKPFIQFTNDLYNYVKDGTVLLDPPAEPPKSVAPKSEAKGT